MRADIAGMKGGQKQFWLKCHRPEVLNFYNARGLEATLIEFNMAPDTLERFLAGSSVDRDRMTKAEARLGELIQQEQQAGRLATPGDAKTQRHNNVVTLQTYGVTCGSLRPG